MLKRKEEAGTFEAGYVVLYTFLRRGLKYVFLVLYSGQSSLGSLFSNTAGSGKTSSAGADGFRYKAPKQPRTSSKPAPVAAAPVGQPATDTASSLLHATPVQLFK